MTPTTQDGDVRILLTEGETAKALRLSIRTVYDLRKGGKLPAVHIGRAVRYDLRDVQAFVDRQRAGASAANNN
jgi:excisionase family DNA binding protein